MVKEKSSSLVKMSDSGICVRGSLGQDTDTFTGCFKKLV